MQVIEKVKVVPEGYNGAEMNYDGGNRRDVNGKANAGLTLGIIGTALGAWALFGNRRSAGASILGGAGGGSGAPTAFQAWEKSCEDTLALQGGLYQWALTQQNQRFEDRERLIQCEMEKMFTAGINYTDRKTCNVIYGVVTLPNEPTVTGLVGRNAYGCLPCGFTQPASGTPAQ